MMIARQGHEVVSRFAFFVSPSFWFIPALSRFGSREPMITQDDGGDGFVPFPSGPSLFLVESPIVCGVPQHALYVASSLGKRDALDPILDVERSSFGDPSLCATGPGVVACGRVLNAAKLSD